MASNEREIRTKLTITGDKEVKAAIAGNASEAKELKSAMALLNAEYEGNTDSAEYLTKKGEILAKQYENAAEKVKIYQDRLGGAKEKQASLSEALDESREKLAAQEKALDAAKEQYGDGSDEVKRLTAEFESNKKAVSNQEAQLTKADKAVSDYHTKVNYAQKGVVNMTGAIKQNNTALGQAGAAADSTGGKNQLLSGIIGDLSKKFGVTLPEGATAALGSMAGLASGVGVAVTAIKAAIEATVEAAKKLVDITLEQANRADEILTQSQITGLGTDILQGLEYAAPYIDVEASTITDSIKKLTNAMGEARDGGEDQAAAFQQLGVSVASSNGTLRSSYDVFLEAIDALGKMSNETERNVLANTVFGRSYDDLAPLINAGSGAIDGFVQKSRDMGYTLSGESLQTLNQVSEAYERLKQQLQIVKQEMSVEAAGNLTSAMDRLTGVVADLGGTLIDSGAVEALAALVEECAAGAQALESLINIPGVGTFFDLLTSAAKGATMALTLFKTIMDDVQASCNGWASAIMGPVGALMSLDVNKLTQLVGGRVSNASTAMSANAAGTPYFSGGETMVGEYGPERVILPNGSQIQNANDTADRTEAQTVNNYITISVPNLEVLNQVVDDYSNRQTYQRKGL